MSAGHRLTDGPSEVWSYVQAIENTEIGEWQRLDGWTDEQTDRQSGSLSRVIHWSAKNGILHCQGIEEELDNATAHGGVEPEDKQVRKNNFTCIKKLTKIRKRL